MNQSKQKHPYLVSRYVAGCIEKYLYVDYDPMTIALLVEKLLSRDYYIKNGRWLMFDDNGTPKWVAILNYDIPTVNIIEVSIDGEQFI